MDSQTKTPFHPDDPFHVILDGLGELLDQIDRGEIAPWENYPAVGPDDPKVTSDGYIAVLHTARKFAENALSTGISRGLLDLRQVDR